MIFILKWITNEDILADQNSNSQESAKIRPQWEWTFVKIADYLDGNKKELLQFQRDY